MSKKKGNDMITMPRSAWLSILAPYAEDWRRAGHDSAARKEWV